MVRASAVHSASFALRPERRLTRAEAWSAARLSPYKVGTKAVKEVVIGAGTFIAFTTGTLLLGMVLGAYTTDMRTYKPRDILLAKQKAELERLRAAAGPPSIDGPLIVRHPTEQDDVGFAGSA